MKKDNLAMSIEEELANLKNSTKTVDQWLDAVSYRPDSDYVPSEFALDMLNFIKMIHMPEGTSNVTPEVHLKVLDNFITDNAFVVNMMHRGFAKSTLIMYMFFYLAVYETLPNFGSVNFIIYISDSMDNGVKVMRNNIDYLWNNSEFLQKVLPEKKTTEERWCLTNMNGNTLVIKGYGAKSGIRGTREQNKRPQMAVLDDLLSDEDARSPTILRTVKDTVYKAVDYALDPTKRKVIWCGTPFNAGDPLYEAVESGSWEVNVYPVCEAFPCEEKDFRGSWEDRFSYRYVKEQYIKALGNGELASFNQELMLRIMSEEDRLILDGDMRYYSRKLLLKNKHNFNYYITTDIATTEAQSGDFSFISVWAVNHNMDIYWVDGVCERQTIDKTFNDIFRMVQIYKPQSVGIEVTGQQEGLLQLLLRDMMTRNIYFNLASSNNSNRPGIRPNTNKLQRFNNVVPLFKSGKIHFPNDMENFKPLVEIISEIKLACAGGFKSKKDDGIDTISMLSMIEMYAPDAPSYTNPEEENVYKNPSGSSSTNSLNNYIV